MGYSYFRFRWRNDWWLQSLSCLPSQYCIQVMTLSGARNRDHAATSGRWHIWHVTSWCHLLCLVSHISVITLNILVTFFISELCCSCPKFLLILQGLDLHLQLHMFRKCFTATTTWLIVFQFLFSVYFTLSTLNNCFFLCALDTFYCRLGL